ncbi:4-alpha-glucanotransferase [Cerasicoccus arenae]|uniref:4-alpha-glucanotransferase n=1 Tax=Cerasicoccus arenae TaxID=424488 RepID=A0A8J3D738_9BACT|nr:4-alpha-glucanotransferase [Cerasicoccus arenae]MBK1859103.1 4-alpha-glucanotransferase [Cerasicoccus arenae]GHB91780.1 4-alpha-glucanotransferase [Cerasicoccus arenae]
MPSPLFNWLDKRSSGVLLHPTSLPSCHGIGNLGRTAYQFVDFLANAGFAYWQICPLGPTGFGDSPYQCFSAFAGNPYLIDLDPVVGFGLLKEEEIAPLRDLPNDHVDYGALYETFWPLMAKAAKRFAKDGEPSLDGYGNYKAFLKKQSHWLDAYAAYRATKAHFKGKAWFQWPKKYRSFDEWSKSDLPKALATDIAAEKFYQYLFFGQWTQLRNYANQKGVGIIGDVPIFVALDSADAWSQLEIFQMTKDGKPKAVAGVPPDYFSPLGQLWGNPLFDWDALKARQYDWWIDRLKANFALYDVVRIDHFRAFHDYWAIPANAKDATSGEWKPGPGIDFFETIKKAIPDAHLIAEDLGDLSPGVHELRVKTGLPGMVILQFAFGGNAENDYLPHNHEQNSVAYAGTHDNDTTLGWYWTEGDHVREHVRRYLSVGDEAPQWDFIRACFRSPAKLSVITLQDLLNLGSDARMNAPGTAQGNWQWRYQPENLDFLNREVAGYLKDLGHIFGRCRD